MSKAVKYIHNVLLFFIVVYIVGQVSKIISLYNLADIMDSGVVSSSISEKTYLLGCVAVLIVPAIIVNILHKVFKKEFIKPGKYFYIFSVVFALLIIFSTYAENSAYRANHRITSISSNSDINQERNLKKSQMQVTHMYNDFSSNTPLEMSLEEANNRAEKFIASQQASLKAQFEAKGFDLRYLPKETYDITMIDNDSAKIAQIKIVETGITTEGEYEHTHFIVLGYKESTLHTIICMNADTNNYIVVPECYEKVNSIFI